MGTAGPISDSAAFELLRWGFFTMSRGRIQGNRSGVELALGAFERVLAQHPDWPDAWLGLGQARAVMAGLHGAAREGPLQPSGVSFAAGSRAALARAIELDPKFGEAAVELCRSDVAEGAADPRILSAIRMAVRNGSSDPAMLLGWARWEAAAGSTDSAIAVLETYIDVGGDTSIGYFNLARQLFRKGDSDSGVSMYFAGARHARTPAAWKLYGSDIAWIGSPEELVDWDSTSARASWLLTFWGRRDVGEGRRFGERLIEHYKRLDYALKHFARDIRGRNGEGWLGGSTGEASYSIESPSSDRPSHNDKVTIDEPDWGQAWDAVVGGETSFKEFHSNQSILDDRGVVYVRHGPPDKIAFYVGGAGTPANVSWKYTRSGSPLVFHFIQADFSGQVGPSVLVSALPRYMLEARCGFDADLCLLSMRRRVAPEQLVRERDRARAAIRIGTTTDEFRRSFPGDLEAIARMYGLFGESAVAGDGRIAAMFAVSGASVEPAGIDSVRGSIYRLRTQATALDTKSGVRYDTDTVRVFRTPHPLQKQEYLTGISELTVPPGQYLVSLVVTEAGGRGSILVDSQVSVPRSSIDSLAISDLILGKREGGAAIWLNGKYAPTNILGTFNSRDTMVVSYVASGIQANVTYQVLLTIAPSTKPLRPVISLLFSETGTEPVELVQRRLGLGTLRKGTYLLRLALKCAACDRTVERVSALRIEDH